MKKIRVPKFGLNTKSIHILFLPPRNVGQEHVSVALILLGDAEQRVDDPLLPEHRVRVRQVHVHPHQPRALLHQVGVILLQVKSFKFPATSYNSERSCIH